MAYSIKEAKALIIKAGLELVEKKLIARTWGNISAKISDSEFIITPSGVPYDQVNNDNLVVVKIEDCSYSGNVKPSGEKKVHAAIYRARKDVTFILHTHQNYATAISVDELDKDFVPNAKYGLPLSKTLVKNIIAAMNRHPDKNVCLMARHGALAYASNYEDAFNAVIKLEEDSKELFERNASKLDPIKASKPYLDDYAQMFGFSNTTVEEDKEAVEYIRHKNALASRYSPHAKPMNFFDVKLQNFVYKKKYSKLKDSNK